MNYRHAFHAGGFADVLKHAVLARILVHLRAKPAAFRVIDTHAGAGLYDLAGPEASRSLEWERGIHRLLTTPIADDVRALLAPYLDVVAGAQRGGPARHLSGLAGDRARAPAPAGPSDRLRARAERGRRARAPSWPRPPHQGDRDRRLDSRSTPMCRRRSGAVSCWSIRRSSARMILRGSRKGSPPRTANGRPESICCGTRSRAAPSPTRWRGGSPAAASARSCARNSRSRATADGDRLAGCGLIVVNPPWTLEAELKMMLPALAATLSGRGGALTASTGSPGSLVLPLFHSLEFV